MEPLVRSRTGLNVYAQAPGFVLRIQSTLTFSAMILLIRGLEEFEGSGVTNDDPNLESAACRSGSGALYMSIVALSL